MKKGNLLFGAIAMLMVSVIAVAGSTFAWFSSVRNPYVDQIDAQVVGSGALMISTRLNGEYKESLTAAEIVSTARNSQSNILTPSATSPHTGKYNAVTPIASVAADKTIVTTGDSVATITSKPIAVGANGKLTEGFASNMTFNEDLFNDAALDTLQTAFIAEATAARAGFSRNDNTTFTGTGVFSAVKTAWLAYEKAELLTAFNNDPAEAANRVGFDPDNAATFVEAAKTYVVVLGEWSTYILLPANLNRPELLSAFIAINLAERDGFDPTDDTTFEGTARYPDVFAAWQTYVAAARTVEESNPENYSYFNTIEADRNNYMYFPVFFRASQAMDVYLQLPDTVMGTNGSYFRTDLATQTGTNTVSQRALQESLRMGYATGYGSTTGALVDFNNAVAPGTNLKVYEPHATKTAAYQGNILGQNSGGRVIPGLYNGVTNWTQAAAYDDSTKETMTNKLFLGTIQPYNGVETIMVVHFYIWIDGNDVSCTSFAAGGVFAAKLMFTAEDPFTP